MSYSEFERLRKPDDLPSIAEFIAVHEQALNKRKFLKASFTHCQETLQIARDILSYDKKREQDLAYILQKPNESCSQQGSVKIYISPLEDFPEFKREYQRQKNQQVMLAVGGPSATDQAVIAALVPEISQKLDKIIYMTRDYLEANVTHSARQYHIRHANALNADHLLTGRRIIFSVLKRFLFKVRSEEVLRSDFLKIDVKPTINLKTLQVYFGNEFNSLKQSLRKLCGRITEHDINRIAAFLGGEFFQLMEQKISLPLSGKYFAKKPSHSTAIHVAFNQQEAVHAEKENQEILQLKIRSQQLSQDEITEFFGRNNQIFRAYAYPLDTYVQFDYQGLARVFAQKKGVSWYENSQLQRVLVTQDVSGKVKVAGVVNQKGEYIYVSKLHVSAGYKADYIYDSKAEKLSFRNIVNRLADKFSLEKPIANEITVATGVSINAIFKKRKNFGEISVSNTHWTQIAENKQYMLVRITAGGNTGSEKYNPAYLLNVIANTRRIFADDFIGIVSAYGCPRAINSKNSTEWVKIAEDFIISYGKGGAGNTKRHFEALKSLDLLGFREEVQSYCNDFESERGGFLGDRMVESIILSCQDFLADASAKTARRLGFHKQVTIKEIIKVILTIPKMLFSFLGLRGKR